MTNQSDIDLKFQFDLDKQESIDNSHLGSKLEDSRKSTKTIQFFSVFFKVIAVIVYLLGSVIFNYNQIFIFVVFMMAFDFWTYKNVCGRFMVGLHWSSSIDETGKQSWIYYSKDEKKENSLDKSIFWGIQVVMTIFWILVFLLNLITFSFLNVSLAAYCLILLGTNLIQFYKCSSEQQQKMKNLQNDILQKGTAKLVNNIAANKK